jgi:hypothetical protein
MSILLAGIAVSLVRDRIDYTLAAVAVLNLVVLACTLYAVLRYTKKTEELVKAAQVQNRSTIRPVLILKMDQDKWHDPVATDGLVLHNIGRGHAFNIHIDQMTWKNQQAEFDPISILQKGDSCAVFPITHRDGLNCQQLDEFHKLLIKDSAVLRSDLRHPIVIRFADLDGQEYLTQQEFRCTDLPGLITLEFIDSILSTEKPLIGERL